MRKILTLALMAMVAVGAQAGREERIRQQEQTRIHGDQGEPYHLYQGPEPQWYVLGLLYPFLL